MRAPGERPAGGSTRVGRMNAVDKPGRRMVEGVASLFVNLIDQRGKRKRCCEREVAQDMRRNRSDGRSHVAEKVWVHVQGKTGEEGVSKVGGQRL